MHQTFLLSLVILLVLLGAQPPVRAAAVPPPATLPQTALVIRVDTGGMQQISGSTLAANGVDLSQLDPQYLHLQRGSTTIPLELNGLVQGRLSADSQIRFYAPPPGDRWNSTDRYLLSIATNPGLRIIQRSVAPTDTPDVQQRSSVIEQGSWREPAFYASNHAGALGDHFFAADLRSGPELPASSITIPLSATLPLASGTMTITLRGVAYTNGQHALQFDRSIIVWHGSGAWSHTVDVTNAKQLVVEHYASNDFSGLLVQDMQWERPVKLRHLAQGAIFSGVHGTWRYQLSDVAPTAHLYDISDPQMPVQLTGWIAGVFEDGPTPRRYLLTGSNTLITPQVAPFVALPLPAPAPAIYIAPGELHTALAPLLDLRRQQGHRVALVDPQALYDRWSDGQISPTAIRNFLRWARATWPIPPQSVTLVGDGSYDPRNYLGRNNPTLIPPYLAPVDRWLGETACDTCYAQLDGDDPLDDLLPDLWIGRLPVKSAAELADVVHKVIGYETASGGMEWRSRALLIADDADGAGDFAAFAETAAAQLPPGSAPERIYFGANAPFGEPDAARARTRTREALNAGAGLVIYSGHSSHWQWATTDPSLPDGYLLSLYDPDTLTNGMRLPVVLAMTCLSSGFHQASFSGTTIDERLVLHPHGGAVAVWGSAGLGLAYGHESLQRGFLQELRTTPAGEPALLGALTHAGFHELVRHANCCQDAVRTFTLLGDPLTPLRFTGAERLYLPLVWR
jgi:hypothetical protein